MSVIQQILSEVERATTKFPTWPTDPLHALAVLGEEYGELTKEMLQLVYEPHKASRQHVREEAIQTAAMAIRLAMSLHEYHYFPSRQHSQGEIPKMVPASEGHQHVGMTVDELKSTLESK